MNSENRFTIRDLQKRWGYSKKGSVHGLIKRNQERLGIIGEKVKLESGAIGLTFSLEDVEKLDRLKEGKNNAVKNHSNSKSNPVFYLIDLNPDWEPKDKSRPPHRIKLGYTDRPIKERLSEFKTSSPTAKVIKIWPCLFEWEKAAITSITREGCINPHFPDR